MTIINKYYLVIYLIYDLNILHLLYYVQSSTTIHENARKYIHVYERTQQ